MKPRNRADRRIAMLTAAIVLATGACAAESSSSTPSPTSIVEESADALASAGSMVPSLSASSTPAASATPSLVHIPVSSDATFSILPVPEPPGFVSDITCSGSIGPSDPVAVVQLHDATVQATPEVVLRDYADAAKPRTACRFASTSSRFVQLIDARHAVIASEGAYAVVDLPEVRYHWFQLPPQPDGAFATFIAVAPGLNEVLWMSRHAQSEIAGTHEFHVTSNSGDTVIVSLPIPLGGRCGSAEDSKPGAYAHSGDHAFVLDQPVLEYNSLVALEGTNVALSVVPPAGSWSQGGAPPVMATWSPVSEALYYRRGADVWTWTPGSDPEVFLPGVEWYYPTFSPDGRNLAYAVLRADNLHDVYLVDMTEDATPRLIGEARNLPAFLNDQQLWLKSEGQGICGPSGDRPLIYSLTDGSESPSVIDRVLGTWPATGSNQ